MSASPPSAPSRPLAHLRMADVMTRNPVCATPGMTVRQLATIFAERHISGAPVVGPDGRLVGIVSRTDLFRRVTHGATGDTAGATSSFLFDLLNDKVTPEQQPMPEQLLTIGDFMNERVITATEDELLGVVARRIAEAHVHRVIVIDGNRKPVGVVTALDFLKVFPLG
jgi:CBS domain-containing protein